MSGSAKNAGTGKCEPSASRKARGTSVSSRKRKADDPEQYRRFREFAREHGADENSEEFDRRFRKVISPKAPVEPK